MKKMTLSKRISFGAICVALCYVLPLIFHAVGGGKVLSPMHFPVLLCGLVCGPLYGALCGLLGPILSSLLSGTPPATMLMSMVPELIVYGALSGLLFNIVNIRSLAARIYISMIPAMLAGRIIGGIAKAFVYMSNAEAYSIAAWASSYFVGTLPGAILQLILIPAIVAALAKSGIICTKEKVENE